MRVAGDFLCTTKLLVRAITRMERSNGNLDANQACPCAAMGCICSKKLNAMFAH